MADPFIGEIRICGFNFEPAGWAFCNGQLLAISSNTALFSILGTTYGGNGTLTFALPNLQARVPIHRNPVPALNPHALGEIGGESTVTLLTANIPAHPHTMSAFDGVGTTSNPANNYLASTPVIGTTTAKAFNNVGNTTMGSVAGNSTPQAHNNVQPYLALNFIIALVGAFPQRS